MNEVKNILFSKDHLLNPLNHKDKKSNIEVSITDLKISIIAKSILIGLFTLGIGGVFAFYYLTAKHKVSRLNEKIAASKAEKIQPDPSKPTIKINTKYFWSSFNIFDVLNACGLTKHYNFEISDKPDFVFFSVFKPGNGFKTPDLEGNFTKIFVTGENVKPDMKKCDWAFSFTPDKEMNNPRHFRLPLYKYLHDITSIEKRKTDPETIKKIKAKKTKFCNFIYSYDIELRNKIFDKLNKYKPVDAPGKARNNMPPLGSKKDPTESRHAATWIDDKLEFLDQYKFTIACENESSAGYTTEKITDPMLRNSIPIYWGNHDVCKDFNGKSFVHLEPEDYKLSKDEMAEKLVKKVIEIDQNDELYEAYLSQPWFPNNQPTEFTDNNKIHEQFKKIFGK